MRCKKAEKLILKSFDHKIKDWEKSELEAHIALCPHCFDMKREYEDILKVLSASPFPEPKPYFWERLRPRLNESSAGILPFWKLWAIKLVPAAVSIVVLLAAGLTFFKPDQSFSLQDEMSKTEILLLQDLNPFQETRSVFEAENSETKNMILIFTSLEENNSVRRYFP